MLKLESVEMAYGAIQAVKGVSVHVKAGEVVAIIGANGAGKSTLLKGIVGLEPIVAGQLYINGLDCTQMPAHQRVGVGVALSPEGRGVFPDQTVQENLMLGAYSLRKDPARIERLLAQEFERFPRLAERRHQMAGTLSGGEQQMLAMGRALMSRPKVLLLDEPSMGLSPIMVDKIFEVIQEVSAQGVTILLVEQNASRALHIADRGYVMESGLITLSGNAHDMLHDPKVREAYLGE